MINNKLYVLTGCQSDWCYNAYGALYRYNPLTDRWIVLASFPAREYFGGLVGGTIGGKFYVAGGPYGHLHMYDPATNKWAARASIPASGYASSGTTLRAQLFVFGSTSQTSWTLTYTPSTDRWSAKAPMPTLRSGVFEASKIMLEGQPRIQVVGGPRPGNNLQYAP